MHRSPLQNSLLIALALLAGCHGDGNAPVASRVVLVQPAAPASQAGAQMSFTGEIRARHETDLAFRVGGKLVSRLVDAGAEVRAGMPLARLDPADLQLNRQSAQAQLAAAESDAATAKADRERYADLLAKKFVSQAAFDARNNAATLAQARVEQARAQAAVSGNQVGYGTLTSDQAGVITAVLAEPGQVVSAGQPVLRLARPEEKEVAIVVPENRIGELKAAKNMTVSLWAYPDLQLKGELRELSPAADAATRTYAARIRILNPPPTVRLGMSARVAVGGAPTAEAPIVVPLAALVDQGQGPAVWIVVDKKARRQPVTVRQYREDGAVLADGLKGGELVVVTGAHRLATDQLVEPKLVTEPPR